MSGSRATICEFFCILNIKQISDAPDFGLAFWLRFASPDDATGRLEASNFNERLLDGNWDVRCWPGPRICFWGSFDGFRRLSDTVGLPFGCFFDHPNPEIDFFQIASALGEFVGDFWRLWGLLLDGSCFKFVAVLWFPCHHQKCRSV